MPRLGVNHSAFTVLKRSFAVVSGRIRLQIDTRLGTTRTVLVILKAGRARPRSPWRFAQKPTALQDGKYLESIGRETNAIYEMCRLRRQSWPVTFSLFVVTKKRARYTVIRMFRAKPPQQTTCLTLTSEWPKDELTLRWELIQTKPFAESVGKFAL